MSRFRFRHQVTLELLLGCLLVSIAYPAFALESEAPNSSAPTLIHGGIEHSVTLPVLPDEIQNGKPFAPVESLIRQQDQKYY